MANPVTELFAANYLGKRDWKSENGGLAAAREQEVGDEGQYRVYDLTPGEYAVGLWYDGLKQGSGVMLYPDNAQPRFFAIAGGEEHRGIDFQVPSRPTFQVSGKVELPKPKTTFALARGLPEQPLLPIAQTLTADDGSFRFERVPAGSYDLFAARPDVGYGAHDSAVGPDPSFARTRVNVSAGNVSGLDLAVAPGRSVAVVLRARGSDKPPEGCPPSVSAAVSLLEPWGIFPPSQQTQVAFGKEQTIAALPPGRIRLTTSGLGASCYQVDAPIVDLSGEPSGPVAIELAPAASIRGILRVANGRPSEFTVVLLESDASASAEARVALPDAEGRFTFQALRPGRYRIAARPSAAAAKVRWVADTSHMTEIEARGGTPIDVELAAPMKGDVLSVQKAVRRVKKGENRVGDPKTEGSVGQAYLPASLQTELAHWKEIVRPSDDDEYIFRSRNGTPTDAHNYLRRHLKPLAAALGVPDLTFQSLRRTFATLIQGKGTPKDAQTQLRHKDILTTMNVYTQPIPESVKRSVEALDSELLRVLGEFGQASERRIQ